MKTYKPIDFVNIVELSNVLEKEHVIIPIEDNYILIKKDTNFLENYKVTKKNYQKTNINSWFFSLMEADYSHLHDSVKKPLTIDWSLLDNCAALLVNLQGKILDQFNIVKSRKHDSATHDSIYKCIFDKHYTPNSPYHQFQIQDIAKGARDYINSRTAGKYFLDASSNIIAGVSFEFKTDSNENISYGYGRSSNLKIARDLADLEAVERYASHFYPFTVKDNIGTYKYFSANHNELVYSPTEFTLEKDTKYNSDKVIYWTQAESLKSNELVWVPEDLAYYANDQYRDNYSRLMNDSSNGVALGGSYDEALLGGVLELIERHSFLASWYGKIKGNRLVNYEKYFSKDMKEYINLFTRKGINIDLFQISVIPNIFVVWALIRNESKNTTMYSYTAAGVGFELHEAINGALLEAIVGYSVQENVHETMPKNVRDVVYLDDHIEYYGDSNQKHEFDFVDSWENIDADILTKKEKYYSNNKEKLIDIMDNILSDFDDILIVNQTSQEMKSNNLFVVKAIIPGFLPMTFGRKSLRISMDTINNLRQNLGMESLTNINSKPHPFP